MTSASQPSLAATPAEIIPVSLMGHVADVVYTLPAGWLGAAKHSGPVRDADGDGFAEIAIGEESGTFPYNGSVLVLW